MEENNKRRTRTFYTLINVVGNFIQQIVSIITNIILPPLIIGKYGSVVNGLITTIKQIINYVQLVGAGISESIVVYLYKPLEEKKKEKISAIYNASSNAFNKSGIIFSIISILIAFIYPLFISENLEYAFIVKIVIILAISGVSEFFAVGKYKTILIADQKMYIVNIAQIIGAIASTILTIILIKLNCSIVIVQMVATITYVLRILILYIYIHKNYKYLDNTIKPDYTSVSKRKSATLHQLATLIMFGSQTLFIANFCGLAEASVYSVYNLVFAGINTVLSTISSAMVAGMGNLMATDDEERVRKVYNIYEFGYFILMFTFYVTALIMTIPFIKIYTNGITDANYIRPDLVILFTIMGALNCLRIPGLTIINAKGLYDETKKQALIEMVICLIGQAILVSQIGVAGVLIGTILAYLYRTPEIIFYSNKKVLKQSKKNTIVRILSNIAIVTIIIISLSNVKIAVTGYFSWLIYAVVIAGILLTIITLMNIIFDKQTAKDAKDYIYNIIKRKKNN